MILLFGVAFGISIIGTLLLEFSVLPLPSQDNIPWRCGSPSLLDSCASATSYMLGGMPEEEVSKRNLVRVEMNCTAYKPVKSGVFARSCMNYESYHWYSGCHPCVLY